MNEWIKIKFLPWGIVCSIRCLFRSEMMQYIWIFIWMKIIFFSWKNKNSLKGFSKKNELRISRENKKKYIHIRILFSYPFIPSQEFYMIKVLIKINNHINWKVFVWNVDDVHIVWILNSFLSSSLSTLVWWQNTPLPYRKMKM